jgi:hypothetical protein
MRLALYLSAIAGCCCLVNLVAAMVCHTHGIQFNLGSPCTSIVTFANGLLCFAFAAVAFMAASGGGAA